MKSYKITKTFEAHVVAENEDEALRIAYEEEFRAIDFVEFIVSANVEEIK